LWKHFLSTLVFTYFDVFFTFLNARLDLVRLQWRILHFRSPWQTLRKGPQNIAKGVPGLYICSMVCYISKKRSLYFPHGIQKLYSLRASKIFLFCLVICFRKKAISHCKFFKINQL